MAVEALSCEGTNVLGLGLVNDFMGSEIELASFARISRYPENVADLADQLDEDMSSALFGMRVAGSGMDEIDSVIEFAKTAYLIRASNFLLEELSQSVIPPFYRAFLVNRAGRMLQGLEDRGIDVNPFSDVFK